MRRSVLLTLAALGGLVSLIGGVGLFSALTDTARTGTNSAESAALAASADIQLATATFNNGQIECGTFSDNLASGFVAVSNVSPPFVGPATFFCIKNVGSQPVTLSASVFELSDVDIACTGDEEVHGDTTCGQDQAGELAGALRASYSTYPACDGNGSGSSPFLSDNAVTPHNLGSLAVGATACFSASALYLTSVPTELVQKAQSDRVTWRYRFNAQA